MKHANPKYDHIQDPLGVIPDDEPVFLMRGTDPATPAAIRTWLEVAETLGVPLQRRTEVRDHLETITIFQLDHKDLVHVPGTQRPK